MKLADSQLIVTWCNLVNEQLNICTPSPTAHQALPYTRLLISTSESLFFYWTHGWRDDAAGCLASLGMGCQLEEMSVLASTGGHQNMFLEKFTTGGGMWSPRCFLWQGTCSKDTGTKRDHLWVGQGSPGKAVGVLIADHGSARLVLQGVCSPAVGKQQLCSRSLCSLAGRTPEHISFSRGKILSSRCYVVVECFQTVLGFFCFGLFKKNNYTEECPKVIPEPVWGSCFWKISRTFIYKPCTYG